MTGKERLDWMDENKLGYGSGWICRWSDHGCDLRLHETSRPDTASNVREAIDTTIDEAGALAQLIASGTQEG